MLIRGGLIHTMTEKGTFVGDILVRNGRILQVGECLDVPESACILDAQGLTVLPGLIDVSICDGPEADAEVLRSEQAAGVTSGLFWPEEGPCSLITSDSLDRNSICVVRPECYTDAQLHDLLLTMTAAGQRPACEIGSAEVCRRILQTVHSTGVKVILAQLIGCDELLEAIALSHCPVVIGVSARRTSSPWHMAAALDALGVTVALSCRYPHAKLRHLPLCAALCAREGVDRERVLQMITTAPAAILGLSDAGCIAPGYRADIAIYDGDPLLMATSHVMAVGGGKIRH